MYRSVLDISAVGITGTKDHTHNTQYRSFLSVFPFFSSVFCITPQGMLISPSTTQQQDAPCRSSELSQDNSTMTPLKHSIRGGLTAYSRLFFIEQVPRFPRPPPLSPLPLPGYWPTHFIYPRPLYDPNASNWHHDEAHPHHHATCMLLFSRKPRAPYHSTLSDNTNTRRQ